MEQRQALIEALDLVKAMGSIIRTLDTENSYCEYWLNDGNENGDDYVPAAIEIAKGLDAPAEYKTGDSVIWTDLDNNECSGEYKITEIKGEIYMLADGKGSIIEAIEGELSKPA